MQRTEKQIVEDDPLLSQINNLYIHDDLIDSIINPRLVCEYKNRLLIKNNLPPTFNLVGFEDYEDEELVNILIKSIYKYNKALKKLDKEQKQKDELYPEVVKEDPIMKDLLKYSFKRRRFLTEDMEHEYVHRLLISNGVPDKKYETNQYKYVSDLDLRDAICFSIQQCRERDEKINRVPSTPYNESPKYIQNDYILRHNFTSSSSKGDVPIFALQRLARKQQEYRQNEQ